MLDFKREREKLFRMKPNVSTVKKKSDELANKIQNAFEWKI